MANYYPLIVNQATANIEELSAGSNLNMSLSGIANASFVNTANANITVNANISGNLNVTGDAVMENVEVSNLVVTTFSALGDISNIQILGGSNGQAIITDGTGVLSWGNVNASNANYAEYANIANVANRVSVANVTGIGNIATINLTGNSSRVLYANGIFAALPNTANANYANFANISNVANSVTLANVSGAGNVAALNLDGSSSNILYGNGVFAAAPISYSNANVANYLPTYTGLIGGTLSTNAQPNVTSLGTLANLNVVGRSNLSAVGNVKITGGTNGQYLQTDGNGNLSFSTINTSAISNGTSNVSIPDVDGNVNTSVGGVANVLVVTTTGANIIGTANISGNANVGNIGATSGVLTGTLSVTGNANIGNIGTSGLVVATGNITGGNLTTAGLVVATGNITGGNLKTTGTLSVTGNANVGNIGATSGVLTGTLSVTGNANVGNIGATSGVLTGTLSVTGNANVGNIGATNGVLTGTLGVTGNANVGNLGATSVTATTLTGTLTTNAQPNVTSVGTLTGLTVNGTSNLGAIGNVKITGGSNGQAIVTDGNGNLSFQTAAIPAKIANGTSYANIPTVNGNFIVGVNSNTWNFGTDSNLTVPGAVRLPGNASLLKTNVTSVNLTANVDQDFTGIFLDYTYDAVVYSAHDIILVANNAGEWTFTDTGNLSAPGNINYSGNSSASIIGFKNANLTGNVNFTVGTDSANITAGNITGLSNVLKLGGANGVQVNSGRLVSSDGNIAMYINEGQIVKGVAEVQVGAGNPNSALKLFGTTPSNSSAYVSIYPGSNITSPYSLVLPTGTGSNGQYLQTDGTGRLSWSSVSTSSISNGNSNVSIPVANGNVNISAVGNANVLVVTGTGANITGTLNTTGNANVGNIGAASGVLTGTLSVTGNANVGNLGTSGLITATGNITGGNLVTGGNITVSGTASITGNANVGNLGTSGLITATGNITGGNLITAGTLSVTGNANIGNIGSNIGVFTGNITAANASLGNTATANNFIGNLINGNTRITLNPSGTILLQSTGNLSAVFSGTGANINGTANISGNANVGNIGANNGVLTGTLSVTGNANVGNIGATSGVLTGTLSVTGNANVGNLGTSGLIVATGNITGGNLVTGGNITVSGTANVTGNANVGNIGATNGVLTGTLSVTGNANVGNIGATSGVLTGTLSVTGNANVGNIGAASGVLTGTLSVTGNANVGNIGANSGVLTGTLSVTGNANVGNIGANNGVLTGTLSVTGNANIGNIETAGQLIAIGNVTAGNLITSGTANVTGNANVGNLGTAGLIIATGNITGGNIITGGTVNAVGNINSSANIIATANVIANNLNANSWFNGNSNIVIASNSYINISSNGQANIISVSSNGVHAQTTVTDDVTITGNLNVQGTATYINTSSQSVSDPIIDVGVGSNNTPLVADDGKDRGIAMHTYGAGVSKITNGSTPLGNTVIALTSVSGIVVGMEIGNPANGTMMTHGTTVTNVGAANVTISSPTLAVIPSGTTLNIGLDNIRFMGWDVGNSAFMMASNTSIDGNNNVTFNALGNVIASLFVGNTQGNTGNYSNDVTIGGNLTVANKLNVANIQNGNSNIIITANGNIAISSNGTANVAIITATGANITGTANISGNANVGNIGANSGVLTGTLSVTGNANVGNIGATSGVLTGTLSVTGNANVGNIGATDGVYTGNVIAGNVYANSGTIGANLLTGTLTTNAQPNITSVGNLLNLTSNGNVDFTGAGNVYLGNVVNVQMTGGNLGDLLTTDGVGNLSWSSVSSGSFKTDTIVATAGQTAFNTTYTPTGDVTFSVNGATLPTDAATVSGSIVTYVAAQNQSYTLKAGDVVTISYLYGAGSTTSLANLSDVNIPSPVSGQALIYNSSLSKWTAQNVYVLANGTSNISVPVSNGNVNISAAGNANVLTVTGTGANLTGSLGINGNTVISGNLTVQGTTTTVNTTSLDVVNPIISVGGGANGAPLTTNDGKDRGVLEYYYTTQPVSAFMGWNTSNGQFAFGSNVTNTGDVITFNSYGNVKAATFLGNLQGNVVGNLQGSLANGNSNVSIATANGAVTIAAAGNTTMTVTGTGANITGLTIITGNVVASNATLGNSVTANWFYGNLINGNSNVRVNLSGNVVLTAVGNASFTVTGTGANVTGTLGVSGNATVANLTSSSNITTANLSVTTAANVTGTLGVSGNVTVANLTSNSNVTTANLSVTANATVTSNLTVGNLIGPHANGNSNVNIATAGGNVTISAGGTANVLLVANNKVTVSSPIVSGDLTINSTTGAPEGGQLTMAYRGVTGLTGQGNGTWNVDVDSGNVFRVYSLDSGGTTTVPMTIAANTLITMPGVLSIGTVNAVNSNATVFTGTTGNITNINATTIKSLTPYYGTKTSFNAAIDTEITVDRYRYRISNQSGIFPQIISNISGTSINTSWTAVATINGAAIDYRGSTGTSIPNSSWTTLYSQKGMDAASDLVVVTVTDKGAGNVHRVTFMRSDNGTTTGYNIMVEKLW